MHDEYFLDEKKIPGRTYTKNSLKSFYTAVVPLLQICTTYKPNKFLMTIDDEEGKFHTLYSDLIHLF